MDELVYLFELDSVRNSPREILRAQRTLFREVALKGNRVGLSFNQLTDSEGFLCGVRDPRFYSHLAALFEMGVLKYSRFAPGSYGKPVDSAALRKELASCRGEHAPLFQAGVLKAYDPLPSRAPQRILRTASHYVQNGVDQCLNDSKGRFLFSALPFRSDNKAMLSAIHYALEYSDPSILDEMRGAAANPGKDGVGETGEALKQQRLEFTKTYVELILRLSREPLAANPPQLEPHPSMTEFLSRVLARCEGEAPPQSFPLWTQLCTGAQVIRQLWDAVDERGSLNQRSDWYAVLRAAQAKGWDVPSLCMAEAIVDLCYNYTIAESIQGLTRSFRDEELFWQDFLQRLLVLQMGQVADVGTADVDDEIVDVLVERPEQLQIVGRGRFVRSRRVLAQACADYLTALAVAEIAHGILHAPVVEAHPVDQRLVERQVSRTAAGGKAAAADCPAVPWA